MTFGQFDLSSMGRCLETNEEGFRCRLRPNHREAHSWDRCEWTDERGARCMLSRRHPAGHVLFWYDEAAATGTRRTLEFWGSEPAAGGVADRAARLASARGWAEVDRRFVLTAIWRVAPLAAFLRLFSDPQGTVRVTFERGMDNGGE